MLTTHLMDRLDFNNSGYHLATRWFYNHLSDPSPFPSQKMIILCLRQTHMSMRLGKDFNFLVYTPAGRVYLWVQDPGTYSSPHGWLAITSDSNFMGSSFRPQSELRDLLVRLAPSCDLATHCRSHCIMCAAQGVKGPCWFSVISTFLPVNRGSPLWHIKHRVEVAHVTPFKGASYDTCWR